MKLFNFLTRTIEEVKPIYNNKIGLYTCGPTVYDFVHLGNLRTFIFEDVLQRTLEYNGFEVKRVMNITDIDDKIIKGAMEKGLSIGEFAAPFEKAFYADLNKLNIKPANIYPKATEHIGQMIKYIEILIKEGLAYVEKDGSVYFDISKFPDYGKLSGVANRQLKHGTRVLADEYSKDDVSDFALWKVVEDEGSPSTSSESSSYNSPWGKGRPGWHIECSVMSQEYLCGEQSRTIDIHAGGIDLLFPHHENEIAQSEGATGEKFVNFFVEGEHLLVDNQKMSKSLGNFYKLKDLQDRGIDPIAFRYLTLTAHYRDKLNFTWQSLSGAQTALDNIRSEIRLWDQPNQPINQFQQKFELAANNDLNMPQAVAALHDLIRSDYPTSSKARTILEMDKVLGLELDKYLGKLLEVPDQVKELLQKRENARKSGDFKSSDQIRDEIKSLGFEVEDTPTGPKIR